MQTLFGYPVTLSIEMPDGKALILNDAIKIEGEPVRMEIDPDRVLTQIAQHKAVQAASDGRDHRVEYRDWPVHG